MLNKSESMSPPSETRAISMPAIEFNMEVLESKLPVLVAFYTLWSRPCQVLGPVLDAVAKHLAGKVKVVKIDADDHLNLSLWYDIQSVPTLLCFCRGDLCFRIVGTASKEAILAKLEPYSQ